MRSDRLIVRLAPENVAMFRFLLEAHDNLAIFTALDRGLALLKIMFAPESREEVEKTLNEISQTVPLQISQWPVDKS